jgi:hypothetical protein
MLILGSRCITAIAIPHPTVGTFFLVNHLIFIMMNRQSIDILILSNGPGELTTWVRPVVKAIRAKFGENRDQIRISVVLSPCPNATGNEGAIALSFPEVDRVQSVEHFFPFLLSGKTADHWDWNTQGIVLFLGGDQFFTVVIGKRLGYRTITYSEWDARWHNLIDRFAVMKADIINKVAAKYHHKFTVVGDYEWRLNSSLTIGLLPGSKAAKLAQGVPFFLAIAEYIKSHQPDANFLIPVAPTLELTTLAKFADLEQNPVITLINGTTAKLIQSDKFYLQTPTGLQVELITENPAHEQLTKCQICLTTVGANTAELGSLAMPMIVVIPTQQLDAMRSWDGLPGLLANLPFLGSFFAKVINTLVLKQGKLFAWPNIWANKQIVPELIGNLQIAEVGDLMLDYLQHPEKLTAMSDRLRSLRGATGAATKIVEIIAEEIANFHHN